MYKTLKWLSTKTAEFYLFILLTILTAVLGWSAVTESPPQELFTDIKEVASGDKTIPIEVEVTLDDETRARLERFDLWLDREGVPRVE